MNPQTTNSRNPTPITINQISRYAVATATRATQAARKNGKYEPGEKNPMSPAPSETSASSLSSGRGSSSRLETNSRNVPMISVRPVVSDSPTMPTGSVGARNAYTTAAIAKKAVSPRNI